MAHEAAEVCREVAAVHCRILPGEFRLDERDAKVWVNKDPPETASRDRRSPAASSVASFLAKQKRTRRSVPGPVLKTDTGMVATPSSRVIQRANSTSGKSLAAE